MFTVWGRTPLTRWHRARNSCCSDSGQNGLSCRREWVIHSVQFRPCDLTCTEFVLGTSTNLHSRTCCHIRSCSSGGTTCSSGGGKAGEYLIVTAKWTVRFNRVIFGEDGVYSARQDKLFFWYFGNKKLYFVQQTLRSLEWSLLGKVPLVYEIIFRNSPTKPELQPNSRLHLTRYFNFIFHPSRGFQASRYSGILFYALKRTKENCNVYVYKVLYAIYFTIFWGPTHQFEPRPLHCWRL